MPTIHTLGHPSKRTNFTYTGNISLGVSINAGGTKCAVSAEMFYAVMRTFRGETIPGGFSMTRPTPGGLGVWVVEHSRRLNGKRLYPLHASFIAAILAYEHNVSYTLQRNSVYLHFPS